ncbi:MAG: 4Fe-4S dicluster domain-containing protein [Chloroflexi bacterium]|nr:4Fe-4S dicluster domain-containing protein [Chloroflexota bacterium]
MQIGFYFDQTRCTGCFACAVACKDWHDIPAGPAKWRRVTVLEEGKFPDLFVAYLSSSCYHCANPACAAACPTSAITKREHDGIMLVDREKCLGKDQCDLCLQACPYGAPQFGAEVNAKMQMCNLCADRLDEGKPPICVAACPMRALEAGPIRELRAKYSEEWQTAGFTYSAEVRPSVVMKAKQKIATS